MADIGSGDTPEIVVEYAKNFLCPWCKVELKSDGKFFRVSTEYFVDLYCPDKVEILTKSYRSMGESKDSHFVRSLWWKGSRIDPKPSNIEDVNSDDRIFRFSKDGIKYQLHFRDKIATCVINDEHKEAYFDAKIEYFEKDNIDPDYLARKIETIRLLK
jgi:hypothetical protein